MTETRLLAAVALLSAAALGTEVVLLRLFAVVQWPHVASTIVSLALLGYGVSGTVLALTRDDERRFPAQFAAGAVLFAVTAVVAPLLAQRLPFHPRALFWEPQQILLLAATFALTAVPFLCAATAVGLALRRVRRAPGRLYAADLLGAGAGTMAGLGLVSVLDPATALRPLAVAGLLAALLVAPRRWVGAGVLCLAVGILLLPGPWTAPHPSPFKPLSRALAVAGARVVAEAHGPLGSLAVVDSPAVPLRHAPGLSLTSPEGPPPQQGVYADGEVAGAVDRAGGGAYLSHTLSALPYAVFKAPRVLALGGGDGRPVRQALDLGAETVDLVVRHRNLLTLMRGPLAGWSGDLLRNPRVRTAAAAPRAFVAASEDRWDLIRIGSEVDGAGLGLGEATLLTVEGMTALLQRTADDGLVSITRPLRLPPRVLPKLLATASEALRIRGAADPARHVAALRDWHSATLIVAPRPLSPQRLAAVRAFAKFRAFDLVWLPGMARGEANRVHRLETPAFHEAARILLGPDPNAFRDAAPYRIVPATDDRPFFGDFFRWRLVPDLLSRRGRGGLGQMEWGVPLLAATLLQAAVLAPLLILLPLLLAPRVRTPVGPGRGRVLGYFLVLGLGFMAIQMAFVQRHVLLLGHPVLAVSVTLGGFLVFAGLGSLASARLVKLCGGSRRAARLGTLAVAAMIAINLAVYPVAVEAAAAWPFAAKAALGLLLSAPLAFAMGPFFPTGLAAVGRTRPEWVPWAWAINGCASVLGALAAPLAAVQIGFSAVLLGGVLFYALAARWVPDS